MIISQHTQVNHSQTQANELSPALPLLSVVQHSSKHAMVCLLP